LAKSTLAQGWTNDLGTSRSTSTASRRRPRGRSSGLTLLRPWSGPASTPIKTLIPKEGLHPAVVAWADARPAGERWAVAFSGGADSLCLLLLLLAHWPQRRRTICALHFNHRLRGAAARGDEVFCRRVCRSLGVAYAAGTWKGSRPSAGEAEARAARFEFFGREIAARRARALWLGHHQDDVAETMLMRLARGSGTAGLAAPRPVQSGPGGYARVRPMLSLKKSEITGALRAAGIAWREDASNQGGNFFRNRIRSRVLPAWARAAGRDALAGAANSRELLEEDDAALEAWTDALRSLTPAGRLDLEKLAGRPRAVLRRALHRWFLAQTGAGGLSRQGFAGLLEMVERGSSASPRTGAPIRYSLGADGFAVIRGKWLRFERKRPNSSGKRPEGRSSGP